MNHKAGFVNIIGKPNVGKSTLMNALIGENLSIVNAKAQTTRHRIKGIINNENYQIIFSDTPGIMKPAYKLHEKMLDAVNETFEDADIMIYVTEVGEKEMDDHVLEKLKQVAGPVFLVINKIDKTEQDVLERIVEQWKSKLNWKEVIPVSALHKFNTESIIKNILNYLPDNEPFFDKEQLTDRNERFFVTEIIREKILSQFQKEIPYSVEVALTDFKDQPNITRIAATIYVARESQKAIILGHQGAAIKKLGTHARKRMEEFLGRKVFLELTVKVKDNWRDDDSTLKQFGY